MVALEKEFQLFVQCKPSNVLIATLITHKNIMQLKGLTMIYRRGQFSLGNTT